MQEDAKPAAPASGRQYHHGNLRAALIEAAEAELTEKGVEAFSLRGVAKRAGVSHAAPAHHFIDAGGLLTALAAEGFTRFLESMRAAQRTAAPDPAAQMNAAGQGYLDFAARSPALFRLIFSSDRPDFADPTLDKAASASFLHLVEGVRRLRGDTGAASLAGLLQDESLMAEVAGIWSVVHGMADLMNSGRLKYLQGKPPEFRQKILAEVLRRLSAP